MPRYKPITAKELVEQLARDPQFQAEQAEREKRSAEFAQSFAHEEADIARDVAGLGYTIESVWDFVNNNPHPFLPRPFVGAYDRAYPVLVHHLSLPHHPRVREGLIRALTVRDGGELVWNALLAEFQTETNRELRWVLSNALRIAMPYKLRRKYPKIAETYRAKGAP